MNRNIALTFVLATFAAGSALAETPLAGGQPVFKASMSREQVQAELQQYQQAGVDVYADGYNPLTTFRSTRTRAEVAAEYIKSRNEVAALNGEDSGSSYLAVARRAPRGAGRQLAAVPASE